jgi:hypothetical protein
MGLLEGTMHIFDEIQPQQLDRRQLHLTILSSLAIAVLATGVALLMYPAIFSRALLLTSGSLQFAFYGFCLLSALLLGYLWDRQLTIRRLTEQVRAEQRRNRELRLKASSDLLNMIPGNRGFKEQLFARGQLAGTEAAAFSVAVVRLYLSGTITQKIEEQVAFADAAQVIHRRLRTEDSIWTLARGVYGIILTGMDVAAARQFSTSVELGLQDAAGVNSRFTADVQPLTFTGRGKSAYELEQAVNALLPRDLTSLSS